MTAYQTITVEYEQDEETYFDITVDLSTNLVWDDYGVPGSPRWLSATDIKWGNYDVDGKEYTSAQMIEKFGEEVVNKIDNMIISISEETDWDEEEPDYDYRDEDY